MDAGTLQAALVGYRLRLAEIDKKMAEIRTELGSKPSNSQPLLRKERRLSPAARKRISDAQKLRWATRRAKLS